MTTEKNKSADDQFMEMPFMQHFIELRARLFYVAVGFVIAFGISFHYAGHVYDFLARPLIDAMIANGHSNPHMIFTGIAEAFFTHLKLAMWMGLFITLPLLLSQVWMFVAPGLYKNEKRAFLPFLIATPILFLMGAAMAYYVVFPMAWKFFLSYETIGTADGLPIQLEAKVNEYLSIVTGLLMAFGFCFELPVLLVLLNKVGLIMAQTLAESRRYAIVLILIVAAIVTPPDVISQLMLAIPMYFLYEISVWICIAQEKAAGKRELIAANKS
ncbi:MAG: twin-arginine translocase subunit TatC [Alphaproteobacteria bacterium]|nr:MAG: twin-arginine translocase subunit TatC [Alphaproteobacteria bacterium]